MSYILVNDIFDEILNENNRLLNELLFADKCIKVLKEIKIFTFSQSLLKNIMDRHEMVVNTINTINNGRLPINLRNSAHSSCDGSSTRPDSMNVT